MFGKLIKAEWRASRRVVGLLCLAVLLAGLVLGGIGCGLFLGETYNWHMHGTVELLLALLTAAAMMTMAIAWAASVFYALWRFYKSRFTEEGYLTFTLPVNTHQNLLASLVNTAIGMVLITLVICACGVLWLAIAFAGVEGFYQTVWEHFP